MNLFGRFVLSVIAGGLVGSIFVYITARVLMAWEKRNPRIFNYTSGSVPPQAVILIIALMSFVGFGFGFYWSW